jgi:hypothetical protein
MFKQHILKQGKHDLVYQGNCLEGKNTNERGMERKQVQRVDDKNRNEDFALKVLLKPII